MGVDQKGKRNAKQSDLPCSVACHRWVKREWEAADEVSEEPNRIKTDERWEPSALSWQGGGSQETERDGRRDRWKV